MGLVLFGILAMVVCMVSLKANIDAKHKGWIITMSICIIINAICVGFNLAKLLIGVM